MATGLESTVESGDPFGMDVEFNTDQPSRLAQRWSGDVPEAIESFQEGDINAGSALLRVFGAIGGTTADVVGLPFDALLNALGVNDKIAEGVQAILETDTGQQLLKVAQDNPEEAKNLLAVMDIASFFPAVKGLKNVINSSAGDARTLVEGGTLGDIIHQSRVKAAEKRGETPPKKGNFYSNPALFLGDMADGLIKGTIPDSLYPPAIAAKRQSGFGSNSRAEIRNQVAEGNFKVAEQAALAKRMLSQQAGRGEPPMLTKGSPLYENYILEADIPVAFPNKRGANPRNVNWNEEGLDRIRTILKEGGLDEKAAERFLTDIKVNTFSNQGASGWQAKLADLKDRLDPSKEGMKVDVWSPSAGDAYRELGMVPFSQAPGTTLNRLFDPKKWNSLPENIRTDFNLMAKISKVADDEKFRKSFGNKNPDTQVAAANRIIKAVTKREKNPDKLDAQEQAILKRLDEEQTIKPLDDIGRQFASLTYPSSLYALGGTHVTSMLADTVEKGKKGMFSLTPQLTNVLSDRHDIFGTDFLFPQMNKSVIIPPLSRQLGNEGKTTERRNVFQTGKSGTKVPAEEMARLEKLSGVPFDPSIDKNLVDYHTRAIGQFKTKAEAQDYLTAIKNIGKIGYLGSDWRQQMEMEE